MFSGWGGNVVEGGGVRFGAVGGVSDGLVDDLCLASHSSRNELLPVGLGMVYGSPRGLGTVGNGPLGPLASPL